MDCEYPPAFVDTLNIDVSNSVEDDDKLRDKVEDALHVYNDYLKSTPRQSGDVKPTDASEGLEGSKPDGEEAAKDES